MLEFDNQDYYSNIPNLEKHALKNSKDRNLENCLVLVHPYHCKLNGEYMSKIGEFSGYEERLEKIFNSDRKISLILYEEPKNYANFSSELIEKYNFDKIIFTNGSTGEPYRRKDLDYFVDKNIFIGGMYNGLCLSNAISEINKKVNIEKINPIREISFNTWFRMRQQGSVFPKRVISFDKPYLETINFDKFYDQFFK